MIKTLLWRGKYVDHYYVTIDGRVYNEGEYIEPTSIKGMKFVQLTIDGETIFANLAHVMGYTYHGCPVDRVRIEFIDHNTSNYKYDNLYWITKRSLNKYHKEDLIITQDPDFINENRINWIKKVPTLYRPDDMWEEVTAYGELRMNGGYVPIIRIDKKTGRRIIRYNTKEYDNLVASGKINKGIKQQERIKLGYWKHWEYTDEIFAKAWIENPHGYTRVIHLDGKMDNDSIDNLIYVPDNWEELYTIDSISSKNVLITKIATYEDKKNIADHCAMGILNNIEISLLYGVKNGVVSEIRTRKEDRNQKLLSEYAPFPKELLRNNFRIGQLLSLIDKGWSIHDIANGLGFTKGDTSDQQLKLISYYHNKKELVPILERFKLIENNA